MVICYTSAGNDPEGPGHECGGWVCCCRDNSRVLTCKTTSTSYELPFDFWKPWNFDPLYSRDFVTPGCLELAGGGGVISTLTGILNAVLSSTVTNVTFFERKWRR
jgi:hypothetical protein